MSGDAKAWVWTNVTICSMIAIIAICITFYEHQRDTNSAKRQQAKIDVVCTVKET